jgi:hypothetical protein
VPGLLKILASNLAMRCDEPARSSGARHGVTPRHVHKLFEGEGNTLSQFALSRRLARRRHCDLWDHQSVHTVKLG